METGLKMLKIWRFEGIVEHLVYLLRISFINGNKKNNYHSRHTINRKTYRQNIR